MSRAPRLLLLCVMVLTALLRAAAAEEPPGPMPAAWTAAFSAVRSDRPPAEIIRDTHYVVSNEDRPQAFRAAVAGPRGGYVGVGSEQNYVLARWARPEGMGVMDFDQVIVDLHRAYGVLFQAAATPDEFINLWREESEERALGLIAAAYPDGREAKGVARAYRIGRHPIPARLDKVRRLLRAAQAPSFLDDPAQYAYLAGLWRARRVFTVRGDLTADRTLRDIGGAAREVGLPVRILYLSNAERYFTYGVDFKKSVFALPFDERSLVLRTAARRIGAYVYIVQDGAGFHAWLRRPGIQSVHQLTRLRDPALEGEAAFIRRLPATADRSAPRAPVSPEPGAPPAPPAPEPSPSPVP